MTPAVVRRFEEKDIEFALAQTQREGWDATRETFEIHLVHDPEGCFVATIEDEPVGMVTTTRYRDTGWLGELIVRPEARRHGIGTLLMEHAIRVLEASGAGTMRLEADPPGIPIYEKLGFVHELESPRYRLDGVAPFHQQVFESVSTSDPSQVAAFDEPHFGDDRERLLKELFGRARKVYRSPGQGPLKGYLVVQHSAAGSRIGPSVAVESRVAEELLQTALSELPNGPVVVALPGVNREGCALLERYGFVPTPSSYRMARGPAVAQGRPENVYAIAGGALG
jgi:ribosomal protein S18 acetylase RimI-like enzyme